MPHLSPVSDIVKLACQQWLGGLEKGVELVRTPQGKEDIVNVVNEA
jgi:hypothetical protein